MSAWYAVYCRPNFEFVVGEQLRQSGLDTYVPVFRTTRQWSDRRKSIASPVFPGYVLARFLNTAAARTDILSKFGVVRILGSTSGIEPIPNAQVDAVRQMLDKRLRCEGHPLIRDGCRVRVKRGSLKGLEGLMVKFRNKSRLVVSIDLLGRSISAEIDASHVEPLQS